MTTATQYPDLRVPYVRLLCKKAHKKTKNARFSLNELPHYARAVVSIALHPAALYSHHQAGELGHVGEVMKQELRKQADINKTVKQPPPRGKYASAAEAVLVALLDFEDANAPGAEMPGAELHTSMVHLLEPTPAWTAHVQPVDKLFPQNGSSPTPCVAWEQLKALLNVVPPLLTQHGRKHLCLRTRKAFALTEAGRRAAQLAAERSTGTWPPKSSTLYPAPVQRGLLLLVDNREGAGEAHHLGEIMGSLKAAGVPAETAHLRSGLGDYLFVHRRRGLDSDGFTDFAVPRILERKLTSAGSDDLAESMRDGRWVTQQAAMTRMAEMIGGDCKKVYLIQGKMRPFNCQCGCVGFGGCCIDKNASQDSQDDEDNLPRNIWYSFARARDEVESLPSCGYEVRQVSSDSRQALASALRREFDEVERDYKAGLHHSLPSVSELRLARDSTGSPASRDSSVQFQLERWTPPPAAVPATSANAGSDTGQASTAAASAALGPTSPSTAVSDTGSGGHAVDHSHFRRRRYQQQQQHQHQQQHQQQQQQQQQIKKRKRASNQSARAKSLTAHQMKEALKRRGDWLPATKPELLSRLQSDMPEDIGRRLREAHSAGHDPSKEGVLRPLSIGFGFLARAAQEPVGSVWAEQDLLELARDSFRLGWCSKSPDVTSGFMNAYNGMSSIKELTKAGSGKEGSVTLMLVRGRGGKRYKLSSEGRVLAEACHLLCHDIHRIENVCSCLRCPRAQPNSVFDNFFVQDSLGKLYNTDGKPKAAATTVAASDAEISEPSDTEDDASPTPRQRRRSASSFTGQYPATGANGTAEKLATTKGGSRAAASWIDDSSDSDGDDSDCELPGWDVASSPEADEVDKDQDTDDVRTRADSSSTSPLHVLSGAAAAGSDASASPRHRAGRTQFDGRPDEDNVTPQQKEAELGEESLTLALSDDDCVDDFGRNEDVTPAMSDSEDLGVPLKIPDGSTASSSSLHHSTSLPSATPARTVPSLAPGGEATWSVRLGGDFQDYPSDLQPRLNLAFSMWNRYQSCGDDTVSPSFISDHVVFQHHGVEYRILFSLGRMFQERADNGKKREVRRSCDTPTVAPLPRRDSGGARLPASPRSTSHGSTSHGSLPAMIASSSIPWSAIEIADLQCAMDEHGRIGRWHCIKGDDRYRFHASRTAADLQQQGKLLLRGMAAGIRSSSYGGDDERQDAVSIRPDVTDTSHDETGTGRAKRARLLMLSERGTRGGASCMVTATDDYRDGLQDSHLAADRKFAQPTLVRCCLRTQRCTLAGSADSVYVWFVSTRGLGREKNRHDALPLGLGHYAFGEDSRTRASPLSADGGGVTGGVGGDASRTPQGHANGRPEQIDLTG